MCHPRWEVWLALLILLPASHSAAQEGLAPKSEEEPGANSHPRTGMWHLGPFYLTPKFRIGSLGLDTNVLYTPTDHTTDFSINGGPGLEMVLPFGGFGRVYGEGFLDYLYFARTASQRKLTGSARSGIDFYSSRTSFVLEESWSDTFSRPDFEVNQRIEQTSEGTRLEIKKRLVGRISLLARGERRHFDVSGGTEYLGVDLKRTLTRNEYRAVGGLDYAISVKTSLVIEDEQDWDRYELDPLRDANSNRIWAGFRTDSTALIAGQAMFGKRFFDFQNSPLKRSTTVVGVDVDWNISPKTKLGGSYSRDLTYSALPVVGLDPLLANETFGGRLDKFLTSSLNIKLFGRITRIRSDDPIGVIVPGQGPVVRKRDDRYRLAGADLGYFFRKRLRVGVAATYGDQNNTIDYLGVKGLVVGATVRYNP